MKKLILILVFVLALTGQSFANEKLHPGSHLGEEVASDPIFLVSGTVTDIVQTVIEVKHSPGHDLNPGRAEGIVEKIDSLRVAKSLTITTGNNDADFHTSVRFVGYIFGGHTEAKVSTDRGSRWISLGDQVELVARPAKRDVGFKGGELVLFVATIEKVRPGQ